MKFTPIQATLKNGETITIREAQVSDAAEIISVVKEYVEESEFIPYIAGEFNPTVEQEESWIQSFIDNESSLLLVATYDNQIIGNISLNGTQREMMKHTACIGMGMIASYRGLGIGAALLGAAINWAKNSSFIEILWLETYSTNETGIALYKKFGFTEIGKHPDFIKISPTEYVDNLIMTLRIK